MKFHEWVLTFSISVISGLLAFCLAWIFTKGVSLMDRVDALEAVIQAQP